MKAVKPILWLVCATMMATLARGQFPYSANDATYGLRSRIVENPSFAYTPSPADWRDINIYQLFTDRFADSIDQLASYKPAWKTEGKNFPYNRNFHHGGDWKGLKNNLDYLSGMGVRAIWMSGVQMNDQGKDTNYTPYHQYHPEDFFKCDPAMGTFAELKELIDACHARGIYVILDVVPNHMCDKNGLWGNNQQDDKQYFGGGNSTFGWWNDGNKHAAPFDSLDYFHNNGTITCWDCSPENLLGQFKGTDDLKTENSQVQGWLDQAFKNLIDATDCDGFRVDAIKHVEYNWIKKWADDMRKHAATRGKNDFIIFGEYFSYDNGALASFCKDAGYSFNSALFFPLSQNIKNVFVDGQGSGQLTQQLNNKGQYGEGANRLVAFIDNHDLNRIALMNGGDTANDVWKLKPALSFLYLATPVPCLFYGTEHAFDQGGHWNGSNKTEDNPDDGDWQRECMFDKGFQPGPAQGNKLAATDAPLYQHIAALNRARANHASLRRGSFTERWSSGGAGAYAFSRVLDQEEALVALNTADGDVSLNPEVGKPDGTEFFNTLNTSEKVTVSGGRISFTLSGKQTKIFVAGEAPSDLWVRGTHNWPEAGNVTPATPVWVNTEAGPAEDVASVKVGYSADGGTTWTTKVMEVNTEWTSQGGAWYNANLGTFAAGTVIKYYIEVADAEDNKAWDNNGGQDYSVTVGEGDGTELWVLNTKNYPLDGEANEGADLYVDTEAGPAGVVTGVAVYFSSNSTTWVSLPMPVHADWGSENGAWYGANLGRFAAGTVVKYYVVASNDTTAVTNNNGGLNFQVTIRAGGTADLWVGDTRFQPANGEITSSSIIQITSETWPTGVVDEVVLAYTVDGATWLEKAYSKVGGTPDNDIWQVEMGPYADGTTLRFAVVAKIGTTDESWDNNGGQDFFAYVGQAGSGLMITNPPGNITVPNSVASYALQGTAEAITTGMLRWTNALTGASGQIAAASPWSIEDVALDVGTNRITVSGETTAGTIAEDNAGNYGAGWTEGSNAGTGFGAWDFNHNQDGTNSWAGVFIGPASAAGITGFGENAFGFYANPAGVGANAEVLRDFSSPMPVGSVFSFDWGVNWDSDAEGSYRGFSLLAAETELVYINMGNSQVINITGGTMFTNYGTQAMTLNFEYVASGSIRVWGVGRDGSESYNQTLTVPAGAPNRIKFYFNGSTVPELEEDHDKRQMYVDNLAITGEGGASETLSAFVTITREEEIIDSNGDGIPDSWCNRYGLDPLTTNLASQTAPNGYIYGACYRMDLDPADLATPPMLMELVSSNRFTFGAPAGGRQYMLQHTADMNEPFSDLEGAEVGQIMNFGIATQGFYRVRFLGGGTPPPSESVNVVASPGATTFTNPAGLEVTLFVSGVNVITSTYTLGSSPAAGYTNGTRIQVGSGLAVGESATLELYGATATGVTDTASYTYTRRSEGTGIVLTNVSGTHFWVNPENNQVYINSAGFPEGSTAEAYIVACVNPPCEGDWPLIPMSFNPDWVDGDWWSADMGIQPDGTVIQFTIMMKDSMGNEVWDNNGGQDYTITIGDGGGGNGEPGGDKPYSTNPTKGQYRSAGITIDGANTSGEWTTNMLVALDMANDDPRSLGDNWTMHEAPIDLTHLWACWDDNNLYIAWQLVDVTDIIDSANAGSAGGGKISNNQGLLLWAVLDTKSGGSSSDMWAKSNTWAGANTPDMQLYMNGNFYSAYMGRAVGGTYTVPEGGATTDDYKTFDSWGITKGKGDLFAGGSELWGVGDADNRNAADAPNRNFLSEGHSTARDSFYEFKIPFNALGITKTQLESTGIGIMVGGGSLSSMDTIPNDPATLNTQGVAGDNSSLEWVDADSFSVPFARIGK